MAGNKKSKQSQTKVVNSEIASVGSILEEVYRFLYGDQPVLIKLYPDAEHPSHSVTCQVNKQSFRDTPEALLRQYGHLFYAEWDCLILVNRKSTLETEKYLNKEVNTTDWMSIVESAGDVLHTQLQQLKIADEQVSGTLIAMYRNI
jgi:hypothetical protein